MPPVRVLFVTTQFGNSGTGPETYARYLWEGFAHDEQIEFHLVAPAFPAEHPRWHASGAVAGSLELYRRLALTALQTAERLGTDNPPIIHVNNSNLEASLLSYRGPLWGQVNDYENADLWRNALATVCRAGWRRFLALARRRSLERRFLARQDLTLCNSDYTRLKVLTEYRPPHPERILTVHKAVDTGYFARPAVLPPDPLSRSAHACKFVFVGSDFVRKGLDTLLEAVKLLPHKFDWHLTVVGATADEVAATFPQLRISPSGRIYFAGKLSREVLRQVLWNADVFVLPSRAEALGVALLEALAAGLPVVATNVGGIPEIVQDASLGLLVPPTAPSSLAAALASIPPWRSGPPPAVGKVLDSFSTATMLARLKTLYLQAA